MSEKLKPCVFCGGTNVYLDMKDDSLIYIECENCQTEVTFLTSSEVKAKGIWNQRVENQVSSEEGEEG